jgi:hypothetical protein
MLYIRHHVPNKRNSASHDAPRFINFLASSGLGVAGLMVEEVARYLPGRRICTRVVAGALVLLSFDGHWPQPVAQALSTFLPPARNERKRRQPWRPT